LTPASPRLNIEKRGPSSRWEEQCPASKEQKEQAKEFLDLIKKSKGSLKVYFAVGKGGDGPGVHIDKKKPKFCVTTLKAKRVTTMLAFGQVKMEDQLTLYCLKPPNENATRKAFFEFFKESEVSIPGVTESKIRVLGPKEWDSAAEDEDAQTAAPPEAASAQTTAPPPPPPPPPPDQRAVLMQEYQKLVPQMKEKAAAVPALQDRLKEAAARFGNLLSSAQFEKAREALGNITNLIQGAAPAAAPAANEERNRLVAAYQKLVPEMSRKGAEQAALRAPLTQAAQAFQDALKAGQLDEAKRMLDQLSKLLAAPAAAPETPPPADGLGQEFAKRYAALKPRLEQAFRENRGDTSKMRAGGQFAVEAAHEKQFDRALKALDQLEKLLLAAAGAAPETPAQPGGSLVAYRQALVEFAKARSTVSGRISTLRSTMQKTAPDERDLATEISEVLDDLNEQIGDAIDNALNSVDSDKSAFNDEIAKKIQGYLAELTSNELVKLVDGNPFGVPVDMQKTLSNALLKVRDAMHAAV